MDTTRSRAFLLGLLAPVLVLLALAVPAPAKMTSEKIAPNVCLTTGGARYVDIPGFPGERIDRRLLNDIKLLERRYKIFITDGYSGDDVHAANGEHPIGLALDIAPNVAAGGTWRDIDALAQWAEPRQDRPISPFRWVGYDGDAGHGRGHHLHLSWNHSETKPGVAPASVYTLRCPSSGPPSTTPPPTTGAGKDDDDGRGGNGGRGNGEGRGGNSGGIQPTGGDGDGSGSSSGGLGTSRVAPATGFGSQPPVVETGGIDG